MTIKELYEKYGDVELTEEQVKQIKECLNIKENKKWRPKEGDKYYYINGLLNIEYYTFINDIFDKKILLTNNYFKTEEEAEFRREQIKVYNELKNFADENNYDTYNIRDYRFLINLQSGNLEINAYTYLHHIGDICFSSEELAEQAIEKVGVDRIKKYLFGVE